MKTERELVTWWCLSYLATIKHALAVTTPEPYSMARCGKRPSRRGRGWIDAKHATKLVECKSCAVQLDRLSWRPSRQRAQPRGDITVNLFRRLALAFAALAIVASGTAIASDLGAGRVANDSAATEVRTLTADDLQLVAWPPTNCGIAFCGYKDIGGAGAMYYWTWPANPSVCWNIGPDFNDQISSVVNKLPYAVTMYQNHGCTGWVHTMAGNTRNPHLGNVFFNNVASALRFG